MDNINIGESVIGGDTIITTDNIEISGTVTSSGQIHLQPLAAGRSIGLAGATGDFNLDADELSYLYPGFELITIGRT